jgi:hypothetical protein
MRLRRTKTPERLEESVAIANGIFDLIKKIPGGAVQRKIEELGSEDAVREYFLRMRFHRTGSPEYTLPRKGVRRHFWRPAVENENSVVKLRSL